MASTAVDTAPPPTTEEASQPAAAQQNTSRRLWTAEEDEKLRIAVGKFGPYGWAFIATQVGTRMDWQCRERWHNHLRPEVKKGNWTQEEDDAIFKGVQRLGTNWALIQKDLPGRTGHAIKNRFYSRRREFARVTGTDPNTPLHALGGENARKHKRQLSASSADDASSGGGASAAAAADPPATRPLPSKPAKIARRPLAPAPTLIAPACPSTSAAPCFMPGTSLPLNSFALTPAAINLLRSQGLVLPQLQLTNLALLGALPFGAVLPFAPLASSAPPAGSAPPKPKPKGKHTTTTTATTTTTTVPPSAAPPAAAVGIATPTAHTSGSSTPPEGTPADASEAHASADTFTSQLLACLSTPEHSAQREAMADAVIGEIRRGSVDSASASAAARAVAHANRTPRGVASKADLLGQYADGVIDAPASAPVADADAADVDAISLEELSSVLGAPATSVAGGDADEADALAFGAAWLPAGSLSFERDLFLLGDVSAE